MRYLLFLLFSLAAFAQAPTVTITKTDGLSHSVVRLTFNVSATFINVRTRYIASPGTCTGGTGGTVQTTSPGQYFTTGQRVVVGGLTPNTTYQICPEVTADNATWSSGVGVSVTTLALPAIHPAPPAPPATFNTNYPDTSAYTAVSVASDCSDFQADLNTAVSAALSHGTVISVPAGTVCTSGAPYQVTVPSPDAILFTPSAVTLASSSITLPSHGFTEGQTVVFGTAYSALPASTSCIDGSGFAHQGILNGQLYPVHVVDANTIQVYCDKPPASGGTQMIFSNQGSGTALYVRPEPNPNLKWVIVRTATPDAQFVPEHTRLAGPNNGRPTAWIPKMASFVQPMSKFTNSTAGNALMVVGQTDGNLAAPISNIRFVGLEFTVADDSADTATSTDPNFWWHQILTVPTDQNIILDRCYVHGRGTPSRVTNGLIWDGHNLAIVDSYFDRLEYFKPAYTGLTATQITSTQFTIAPGTYHMGSTTQSLANTATINFSGGGSGRALVYFDMSGNFKVNFSSTVTPGSCTGTGLTCTVLNTQAAGDNSCSVTDAWPVNAVYGNPAAAGIACVTITSGAIASIAGGGFSASRYATEGANYMIGGSGPGPYEVLDTFIEGVGNIWHHDDGGGDARIRNDYTYNRDTFLVKMSHLYQTPNSDGLYYGHRHSLEWKSGGRIAITGTIFDGATTENTPIGDFFEMASDNGGGVHDVLVQNDTFQHGPAGFDAPTIISGGIPQGPPPVRLTVKNNLFWDISYNYHSICCFGGLGGKGWILANGGTGAEDTVFDHNTVIQNNGTIPSLWYMSDTLHEGVQFTNNFLYLTSGDWGFGYDAGGYPTCGSIRFAGKASADCVFTGGYRFDHNVLMSNGNQSAVRAAWPNSLFNYIPSDPTNYANAGFFNYDSNPAQFVNGNPKNYNFRVKSNYCANCGHPASDGTDVGANIDVLEAAQGKVTLTSVPANTITSTSATVTFVAPDVAGCSVDYSSIDPAIINGFTRVADVGGDRVRNISLSGLTPGTVYYFRVNCAVEQPTGKFQTP